MIFLLLLLSSCASQVDTEFCRAWCIQNGAEFSSATPTNGKLCCACWVPVHYKLVVEQAEAPIPVE